MPLRNQKPYRHTPEGLTDAVDGSETFKGALYSTQNMIRQVNTKGVYVPRPAMVKLASIPDFGGGPAVILDTFGVLTYGMAASATFPGKDKPFIFNNVTNTFVTINGITSGNLPTSQPATGDWIPPTLAVVAGRVIFTHPGFAGGTTLAPQYLTWTGTTVAGSPIVGAQTNFSVDPTGLMIIGPGILAGTVATGIAAVTVTTTGTGTAGNSFFTVASAAGLFVGMGVYAPGLTSNVVAIAGTTITVQSASTIAANFAGATVTFVGTQITISPPATLNVPGGAPFYAFSTRARKFGWLDISGFSTFIMGSTSNLVPVIAGAPNLVGIQPGMAISGPNLPAGTVVLQTNSVSFTANCLVTTGSNQVFVFDGQKDFAVGQQVSGVGIPQVGQPCVITNIDWVNYVLTISQYATATTGATLTFFGGIIIVSNPANAFGNNVVFLVAGGTPAAPQWNSGDLDVNPLAGTAPAVFVDQFSNRAWYGVNTPTTAGVQASDSGTPTRQTSSSQTLTFDDGVPVNAAAGLALFNQLGGIVQSLMVFQQDANIRQITGEFSTNSITVNSLQTATGTFAPNSIAPTPKGLLFRDGDGLRLIDFDARVSDPLGVNGKGLSLPFVNAINPSRIAAAYNEDVYRVTVTWLPPQSAQKIWGTSQRTDEFWFHLSADKWSGPHTSTCDQLSSLPVGSSFITAPMGDRGSLYRSDPQPVLSSSYAEFGHPLACVLKTVLLPDNPEQMATLVNESSVFVGLTSGSQDLLVTATDDLGETIGLAYLAIGPFSTTASRAVLWGQPLIFRQMTVAINATAAADLMIGPINLRYQLLGYQLPYAAPPEYILGHVLGGGGGVLGM